MKLRGKRVLITGGTSGIGLALVDELLRAGADVVVCGRDRGRLEALRAMRPAVSTVVADIGVRADVARLAAWCASELGGLDVLVQNAGVAFWYDFASAGDAADRIEEEVRTNLVGPLILAAAFLPVLARSKAATLCIVSSGLAYVPLHCYPVYSATKAGLHSFARSLRAKAPPNVRVLEVLPPFVDTPLVRDVHAFKISAQAAARAIRRSIEHDRRESPIGLARLLPAAVRVAPNFTEAVLQRLAWKKRRR
ncbi:MAG TPA: SDR family NAD(P)-dependent oxidoreductase [Candidatus Elarobacter sp.]|nr:SDR family NAD(P)-dependent oxidoreductase [Candidatus Elarobacter sp.]